MRQNDQQHIDAICLRHGIKWLSKMDALFYAMTHPNIGRAINSSGDLGSFSVRLQHKNTGEHKLRGIFISRDELEADAQEIFGAADIDEHEYFVALHELGHNILQHDSRDGIIPLEKQAQNEIDAWEWAFAHAQYWPSDETILAALNACTTYTHMEDAMIRGEIRDKRHACDFERLAA
jgi:hypothetical protein